ncbi:MAG: chorismate mutase [Bacteroidetes bacterium]|nr:chorismate mutase [Rhodothermaceae bacterium RA]RMH58542.1 MAG: chorismate mutase [Bacteroidota bacterium]
MPSPSVQELLLQVQTAPPVVPETPTEADLRPWRDRIDALDRVITYLLNERAVCANKIGHIKKKLGMPVYVPSREEDVLRNVVACNPGPLPDEAVRRLFERVIDETRSLERQRYQTEPLYDGRTGPEDE